MVRLAAVFKESAWFRAGLLALVVLGLAWTFGVTPHERQTIGLKLASVVGYVLPALGLGVAWGWIMLSWRQAAWATAILLALTAVVVYQSV